VIFIQNIGEVKTMDSPDISSFVYPAVIIIFFWLCYVFGVRERILGLPPKTAQSNVSESVPRKVKADTNGKKAVPKKRTKSESSDKPAKTFSHPWLAGTLKGHTAEVHNLHLSPNGNILASCAADRTVRLWLTKDFQERDHKQIRVNIEFDSASRVHWSPDNKAFLIAKSDEKSVEVFKLGKKPDGSMGNITKAPLKYSQIHKQEIVGLGVACSGKFMMTCSSDSQLVIWDLKGILLDQMEISQGTTHSCKMSPCGRYIGACGHYESYPNLVVREVNFKDQVYVGLDTAFTGGGHKTPIHSFDFNTDSSRIVTLDTKSIWKLFDTSGNRMDVVRTGASKDIPDAENRPVVCLSHDGRVIIVAIKNNIEIYSALSGSSLLRISDVHSEPIRDVQFSFDDLLFITCGDRVINVFNNISGYEETIRDLHSQIGDKSLSQALKNRLSKQLTGLEAKLVELKV